MKIINSLLASFVFVLFLIGIHLIHNLFFKVNVVFYSAIADGILAVLFTSVVLFMLPRFKELSSFEKGQLLVIWLMAGYAFAISVPTVIDRSLSFYILEKLLQRGGAIKQEGFSDIFINEYMKEHRLVDVRLTEQMESGTIVIENGCVRLTDRGTFVARMSRLYRTHLLPKHRLLMGEYTDALTDPFRHSEEHTDYLCK